GAPERLGPVGNLLGHPGWGVPALAPQLLGHAAHVLRGRPDLLTSLGGPLVDLVTEPAAGLAERALGLVLGQLCRVADLVFDLLGGRTVSGRDRPECGV